MKMDFLQPFLKRVIKRTPKSNPKVHEFELRKKSSSPRLKVKKRVRFELNEPTLIQRDEENEDQNKKKLEKDEFFSQGVNNGTQIKILMTKEEAALFLSRCKDGGILELKDVISSTANKD